MHPTAMPYHGDQHTHAIPWHGDLNITYQVCVASKLLYGSTYSPARGGQKNEIPHARDVDSKLALITITGQGCAQHDILYVQYHSAGLLTNITHAVRGGKSLIIKASSRNNI